MNNINPSTQLGIVSAHYYQRDNATLDGILAWGDADSNRYHQYWTYATKQLTSLRDRYAPNALISWGEFGPSTWTIQKGSEEAAFTSVGTALWAADVLGRAARAGADVMQFDNLTVSAGQSTIWPSALFINDFSKIFPIGYTYIMFGQWWGDSWVLDVNSTDESKLSVNGSVGNDGSIYIMLINKTENQDLITRVSVQTNQGISYFSCLAKAHSVTLVSIGSSQDEISKPVNLKIITN